MKYTVTGRNKVFGYATGETFEMELDQVTEARLVAGGHIARADRMSAVQQNDVVNNNNDEEELGSPDGA